MSHALFQGVPDRELLPKFFTEADTWDTAFSITKAHVHGTRIAFDIALCNLYTQKQRGVIEMIGLWDYELEKNNGKH